MREGGGLPLYPSNPRQRKEVNFDKENCRISSFVESDTDWTKFPESELEDFSWHPPVQSKPTYAREEAIGAGRRLTESVSDLFKANLPPDILSALKSTQLDAAKSRLARRNNMERLKSIRESLLAKDAEVAGGLHESVQPVRKSAGDDGSHLAFLEHCLRETGYNQSDELLEDLKRGFPLVGRMPVEQSAKPRWIHKPVREAASIPKGREAWESSLNHHKRKMCSEDPETLESIWRQTQEDINLGRIEPSHVNHDKPIPTHRFAIKQQSSTGKTKIRCIDDFRRSMRNDTNLVVGRIRLGRIRDALDVGTILHQNCFENLAIFKTDFQSAYRCLPILPEHQEYSQIVTWNPHTGTRNRHPARHAVWRAGCRLRMG